MGQTLEATFDGNVFRPDGPVELKPNTRVRITIEPAETSEHKPESFLRVARSLKLQGPPDWSSRLGRVSVWRKECHRRIKSSSIPLIIPVTEELYQEAFELYRNRPDKEWGLIDCLSFIVISEHKLTDALTADDHFRQAGFRVLLQESSS